MIIVAGTIRVPADRLAEARPVLTRMIEATRAEPGCLTYSFAEDLLDPGLIRVFEIYVDAAARQAHSAGAHMKAFREAWPALGIGDRQISDYEISAAPEN